MAGEGTITKASDANADQSSILALPQVTGDMLAGEDIGKCDLCYVAADGLIYKADGTAADIKVLCPRLSPAAAKAGQAVALFGVGARWRAAAATTLTPGSLYYLSAVTPGSLSSTATTGDSGGTVQAISDTDVVLVRPI